MVPAAAVFKALGGTVQFNSKVGDVSIKYDNIAIAGKLNSKYIQVNGMTSFYTIPIQAVNGKLMVLEIGYGASANI